MKAYDPTLECIRPFHECKLTRERLAVMETLLIDIRIKLGLNAECDLKYIVQRASQLRTEHDRLLQENSELHARLLTHDKCG